MASNHARATQRNRAMPQRVKVDENATSRLRQPSGIALTGASRIPSHGINGVKGGQLRPVLNEVTTTTVNRKDPVSKLIGKEKEETGLKRGRSNSSSTAAQRIPLGPGRAQVAPPVANAINARAPLIRAQRQIPVLSGRQISRIVPEPAILPPQEEDESEEEEDEMDVEVADQAVAVDPDEDAEDSLLIGEREVEEMVGVEDSDDEEEVEEIANVAEPKPPCVWPEFSTNRATRYHREVQAVRDTFEDDIDAYDTTMVSEYADEIFEYMCDLETDMMPNPDYMSGQNEITWGMRQTLVDWLLQVHLRYHMLPETLWIAINIVDRFLTKRVVSLVKLQLVGVTAMFIAAKYEEIMAPSVEEFVYMTENGYTKDEILKGERIVLQTLDFRVSQYCSPYSWMRKISKADDYDIQTRTLSKFLTEVTLLDYRFLTVKPSLVAAVGMYCARRMLGGDWNEGFVFYSGFTEEQLIPGHNLLVEKLMENNFSRQYVCKKYANKKFLKASIFAIEWATSHVEGRGAVEKMLDQ